jgi:dCMP deaminase
MQTAAPEGMVPRGKKTMQNLTLELLFKAAQRSDDLNTQTSAILATSEGEILISGSNTLTKGVEPLPERCQRPGKLPWIEHSERNVVFEAARKGVATEGAHMHMRWFPCVECARAIAQSGISTLYCDPQPEDHPQYQFAAAAVILEKANIELRPVGTGPVLKNGEDLSMSDTAAEDEAPAAFGMGVR